MKIFLKIYYCLLFAIAFLFEMMSAVTFVLNEVVEFLQDKLINHMVNIDKKIDKDEK